MLIEVLISLFLFSFVLFLYLISLIPNKTLLTLFSAYLVVCNNHGIFNVGFHKDLFYNNLCKCYSLVQQLVLERFAGVDKLWARLKKESGLTSARSESVNYTRHA